MARTYVPERGDAVWLDFGQKSGHEQLGRRLGLVISPRSYNKRVGLAVICPITSRIKGYPFEVVLPSGLPIEGAVLADQPRSLDWSGRSVTRAGPLPKPVVDEVIAKLAALLYQE